MAQDGAKWQKGQDVEIYDPSQEKWILGTIYDIRQEDGQNIYSVEYDEYSQDIHQKNAPTHLRSPNTAEKTDDREAEETFLNFSEQIAPKLPKSKQMTILSKSVRGIASQRMMYLSIERSTSVATSFSFVPLRVVRESNLAWCY